MSDKSWSDHEPGGITRLQGNWRWEGKKGGGRIGVSEGKKEGREEDRKGGREEGPLSTRSHPSLHFRIYPNNPAPPPSSLPLSPGLWNQASLQAGVPTNLREVSLTAPSASWLSGIPDRSMDAVVCINSMGAAAGQLRTLLGSCARVLRDGGVLLFVQRVSTEKGWRLPLVGPQILGELASCAPSLWTPGILHPSPTAITVPLPSLSLPSFPPACCLPPFHSHRRPPLLSLPLVAITYSRGAPPVHHRPFPSLSAAAPPSLLVLVMFGWPSQASLTQSAYLASIIAGLKGPSRL